MITLQRPIAFLDLETTGTNPQQDKITQIAIIKLSPAFDSNNLIEKYSTLVNPERVISQEVVDLTQITNEMTADAPTFKQTISSFWDFIEGCDLAGHNIMGFDLQILSEEIHRVNPAIRFPQEGCQFVDTMRFFEKILPRTLDSAYDFFVGKPRSGARHNAENDIEATVEIFQAQLAEYGSLLGATVSDWHKVTTRGKSIVDLAGKMTVDPEGYVIWTFGKNEGKRVYLDMNYCGWVLKSDFPTETKTWIHWIIENKGLYERPNRD